jgi:hypothetical protein
MNGFDTLKVLNYMNSFSNLGFEAFLNDLNKNNKDSITSHKPMAILTVTDITGKVTALKAFLKLAEFGSVDDVTNKPITIDRDHFYGLVNNEKDFVLLQYYIFNSILQPASYFRLNVEKK